MPSGLKRFRKAESLHFTNRLIETDYPDGSKKTVDLYHRPKRRSCLARRLHSRFHGWLHRSCLRGLAPPACTNLPSIKLESNVLKKSYVINPEARARRPQLFFHAQKCADCGACASTCTQQAIIQADDLPADKQHFAEKNAAFFK